MDAAELRGRRYWTAHVAPAEARHGTTCTGQERDAGGWGGVYRDSPTVWRCPAGHKWRGPHIHHHSLGECPDCLHRCRGCSQERPAAAFPARGLKSCAACHANDQVKKQTRKRQRDDARDAARALLPPCAIDELQDDLVVRLADRASTIQVRSPWLLCRATCRKMRRVLDEEAVARLGMGSRLDAVWFRYAAHRPLLPLKRYGLVSCAWPETPATDTVQMRVRRRVLLLYGSVDRQRAVLDQWHHEWPIALEILGDVVRDRAAAAEPADR